MDITFNVNFLGFIAIVIICGCIVKIVENIVQSITIERAFGRLSDFTDEQRDRILNMVEEEEKKKK